jgi:flagellar assembly protein FliH
MDVRLGEAHQTGYHEGEAAGRSHVEPVIQRLAASIEALTTLRPRLRREAEADLLKLAVAIARRILHRELTVDPDAVLGLIRAALDTLQAQENCRVRVHPDHEAVLRAFLEQLGPARQIEVTADRTLEPGGVLFETSRGNLDSSVETQLQEIERGLADRLRRKP